MKKSLFSLAIMAFMPLLAVAASDYNRAYVYQAWYGVGNSSIIDQRVPSSGNDRTMDQSDNHNSGRIHQESGPKNEGYILQDGSGNMRGIKQGAEADNTRVTIEEYGAENSAQIYQHSSSADSRRSPPIHQSARQKLLTGTPYLDDRGFPHRGAIAANRVCLGKRACETPNLRHLWSATDYGLIISAP